MALRNELESTGGWLFRHRSYLPLVAVPILFLALVQASYLGGSHEENEIWQAFCILVSFAGLALRALVVGHAPYGTSGRNTREQVADSLSTTGMYSVVRHPLYLGNYIIALGIVMAFHILWLVLLSSAIYALYYERIMLAEEAFLRTKYGEVFEAWAAKTPAFIPRLHGWKPFSVPFCWRTVAQREYNGLFVIITSFFVLDTLHDSLVEKRLQFDTEWLIVFGAGMFVFTVLRTLKKRTGLLTVADR